MEKTLDEIIEEAVDKYTKALTKATQGEMEVVSFDTVVLDVYEMKKYLKSQILSWVESKIPEDPIEDYDDKEGFIDIGFKQAIDQFLERIREEK